MATEVPNFETIIANERARIAGERDKLVTQKTKIDEAIAKLDLEMRAITAYEDAKAGKLVTAAPYPRTRAPSTSTGTRRGGQREAVLAVIEAHPDGISPKDILAQMKAESKADQTSVRNALSALKRNNNVATKDGKYVPALPCHSRARGPTASPFPAPYRAGIRQPLLYADTQGP
jgi:hypothetical protein